MQGYIKKVLFVRINTGIQIIIGVILFALTIEVCARIDDMIKYGAPLIGAYGPERLRATDPDGIRHNVPNSRFEKWWINQNGFRGADVTIEKREGVKRIVCMGTSETFGLYENPGKEWPAQLQDILDENGSYEIINASVAGLVLDDYLPYMQKYVLRYKPDAVILLINPFIYVQTSLSKKKLQKKKQVVNSEAKNVAFQLQQVFPKGYRMLPKLKQSVKIIIPQGILKYWQIWDLSNQISVIERKRLNGNYAIKNIPTEILSSYRSDLERLIDKLAAFGIDVFLSSYPSLISKSNLARYPEVFLDYRRFCISLSNQGMIDALVKLNNINKEVAEERIISYAGIGEAISKEKVNFGDSVHFTNEGARLVASYFADLIIQRYEGLVSRR